MKPSPKLQAFIEQLAAKYSVDLSQPHRVLRLTMPDRDGCLLIESDDGRHVSLSRCFADAYGPYADPYILLLMDYLVGWLPLDLYYSPTEWQAFVQANPTVDDPDAVGLVELTEHWATLFTAQGWLERSVQDEPGPADPCL